MATTPTFTYTERLGGAEDREWLISELRDALASAGICPADVDIVEECLREQLDGERF